MTIHNKQSGFTTVELLITLFIAAAFLISGYQLYMLIIKGGGETRMQARASNVAYDYLQRYKSATTNPCTEQMPLANQSVTVSNLSNTTITVSITCPYGTVSAVSKITVNLNYGDPQRLVTNATFISSACPSGFIPVPGSATYGTKDFCVMKYEAKNDGNGNAVSTAAGTPWVSIAQSGGTNTNVALGKTATNSLLTDGNTATASYYDGPAGQKTSVTVDLGQVQNINMIKVWHYYADTRIYYDTKAEVSVDNINWTTVFDSAVSGTYAESAAGRTTAFAPINVRYIRDWANQSNVNAGNHWVEIQAFSTLDATSKSAAACTGCHLITEAEWMTIAQNVLSVASNWSTGTVGNGFIYSGHNDNVPANALAASSDDTDVYYLTGNTAPSNQQRTFTLTNGQVIWDLAGNVWQWTSGQITGNQPGVSGGGYAWREWTAVTANGNLAVNPFPSNIGLSGSSGWNSGNGIGQIYSSTSETALHGFLRGGYWNSNSIIAGVLSLELDNTPSLSVNNVGFRVSR
jgi:Tfp pilus assembly protein PilE